MDLNKVPPLEEDNSDNFDLLDAMNGYELVIGDKIDREWAAKLRKNNWVGRADVIDDKDRIRRATVAMCYQKYSDICDAFCKGVTKTSHPVMLHAFKPADPYEEMFAFLNRAATAHFDDKTRSLFFELGLCVITYTRQLERGDTITEYAIFGMVKTDDISSDIDPGKVPIDNLYLLARFGNEGIIPTRELLYRQEVKNMDAIEKARRDKTRKENADTERERRAEKAIAAYGHSKRRMIIRGGGSGLVTGGAGVSIFVLGLAALWFAWVALAVMLVMTGVVCYRNEEGTLQVRAARLKHTQLSECNRDVVRKALKIGRVPQYRDSTKTREFGESIEWDPQLYKD